MTRIILVGAGFLSINGGDEDCCIAVETLGISILVLASVVVKIILLLCLHPAPQLFTS